MEALAIYIKGGLVQGVYSVLNAPHDRVIIVDDDNLGQSGDKVSEALQQLEGYDLDGVVEYKELHTELSDYINSEDLVEKNSKSANKNDILSFLTLDTDEFPEVHEWMATFSKVIYKDQEELGEDIYSSDLHEPFALLNEDTEIPPFMEEFRNYLQELDVAYVRFVEH